MRLLKPGLGVLGCRFESPLEPLRDDVEMTTRFGSGIAEEPFQFIVGHACIVTAEARSRFASPEGEVVVAEVYNLRFGRTQRGGGGGGYKPPPQMAAGGGGYKPPLTSGCRR
jgi:hypothetical protein